MKIKIIFFSFLLSSIFSCSSTNENETKTTTNHSGEVALSGAKIFETNCKLCHAFTKETSNGMAPVLDSVFEHWKNMDELKQFIKNATANKAINEHMKSLSDQWKDKTQMPVFEALTDEELTNIVDYLKNH
jgi:cytochrome c2